LRKIQRPWLGVSFRIINGELNIKMSEVPPPEALRYVQPIGRWMASLVEPLLAIESGGSTINESPSRPIEYQATTSNYIGVNPTENLPSRTGRRESDHGERVRLSNGSLALEPKARPYPSYKAILGEPGPGRILNSDDVVVKIA
jgi:hypothetical protein